MAENKLVIIDFKKYPDLLAALDTMVEKKDTDRSKFIRGLVREAVEQEVGSEDAKRENQAAK